ncbi:response regulator [Rheinheimera sp. MMS21-TC3]|uniref:response regulator n=1 Tax=Rheinheimera sp. MMS21-TC3 TaxID=3072790 RepID=UPI0028C4B0A0|nr:response regulator [Rheinheimera sp. MMS21-TC3]WNO60025.1 response regulator [Rheinheimera sp. MMS21-TC3]
MNTNKQILVAEDDDFLRLLLQTQCEELGVKVDTVENGEQLLTAALSYQYDIIITDIQMPICDGIEAMQLLRQLGYNRPIFAMSADPVTAEGFDDTLTKPVDNQHLANILLQTSSQKRIPLVIDDALTKLFYENLQQQETQFQQALAERNANLMRQICHKVKGGAASFGHAELTNAADKLQTLLQHKNLDNQLLLICQQFGQLLQQCGEANASS